MSISNGSVVQLEMPHVPAPRNRLKNTPVPGHKRVLLAAPRGYCAGVDRAVVAVEKALENYGAPVYVRKQIVHNIHVVSTLERAGAIFVDDVDEVPEGSHVVFSAHGVSPTVVADAAERDLAGDRRDLPARHEGAPRGRALRDATTARSCSSATPATRRSRARWATRPSARPSSTAPHEVADIVVDDPDNLVWLSQTTLSVDETMETVRLLRERFPNLQDPPSDDICYATQNRQVAIKKVAPEADLVIVVGSANSSNTMRLVDVALEHGAKAAYRVDYASEIQQEWLDGVETVGVTSGASVPEVLVQEVLDDLSDAGFTDVSTIVTAEEDLMFSLPKELRTDAAGNPDERGLGGRNRKLDWQRAAD